MGFGKVVKSRRLGATNKLPVRQLPCCSTFGSPGIVASVLRAATSSRLCCLLLEHTLSPQASAKQQHDFFAQTITDFHKRCLS